MTTAANCVHLRPCSAYTGVAGEGGSPHRVYKTRQARELQVGGQGVLTCGVPCCLWVVVDQHPHQLISYRNQGCSNTSAVSGAPR
jgi:hypothetical protein